MSGRIHDRLGRFLVEVLRESDQRDPRPLFALGFRLGIALGQADPELAAKVRRAIEVELAADRPFRTVDGLDRQATDVVRALASGFRDDLGIREGG